jgi:hypothetical protein
MKISEDPRTNLARFHNLEMAGPVASRIHNFGITAAIQSEDAEELSE